MTQVLKILKVNKRKI